MKDLNINAMIVFIKQTIALTWEIMCKLYTKELGIPVISVHIKLDF